VVTNAKGDPLASSGTINGLKAADLRGAYGLAGIPGASTKVAAVIIPYDYPKLESNLATYRTAMGLTACTIASGCLTRVYQNGVKPPSPPAGSNWGIEVSLDTQMISAMCPECKIRVYEASAADSLNLSKMIDQANADVAAGIPIVVASNSYGNTEATWFADANIANDAARYQSANFPIVFASGDTGYGVNCPACLNTVLAVGGTTLKKNSSGVWTETAWAKAGSGCDSGTDAPYQRPSWNITPMPPAATCSTATTPPIFKRVVADVSAVPAPRRRSGRASSPRAARRPPSPAPSATA
jgi:subtilase family serine protease